MTECRKNLKRVRSIHPEFWVELSGELWNIPPGPSKQAMELFKELTKQSRERGIKEGVMEYRFDRLWIDIVLVVESCYRFAIEVDGPNKSIDPNRKKFLWLNGWYVIQVKAEEVDSDPVGTAKKILDEVEEAVARKIN